MRNYFTLGGTDSRTFGVYISGQGTFNAPTRESDMLSIPGRNGDLIGFGSRLANAELTYPAFIYANFRENLANFRAFLMSDTGYRRLVDTYNPGEYRLAAYSGGLEVEPTIKNDAGAFDIVFNVKPQRFLLSGEEAQTLTASGTIDNPTLFNSKPLLRVYGAGTLGINSDTIVISTADVYTDIDCETMYAYKGSVSKNQYVSVSGLDFPVLRPGANNITLGSGITSIEITPRWWTV